MGDERGRAGAGAEGRDRREEDEESIDQGRYVEWFTETQDPSAPALPGGCKYDHLLLDDRLATVRRARGGEDVVSLHSIGSLTIRRGFTFPSPRLLLFGFQGHFFYLLLPMEVYLGLFILTAFISFGFGGFNVVLSNGRLGAPLASFLLLFVSNIPSALIVYARHGEAKVRTSLVFSALFLILSQIIGIVSLFFFWLSFAAMVFLFFAFFPVYFLIGDAVVDLKRRVLGQGIKDDDQGAGILFQSATGAHLTSAWIKYDEHRIKSLKALHYNALL